MIKLLVDNNKPLFWVIFHLALGALSTISGWVVIAYFYFFVLTSLGQVIRFRKINSYITVFVVYLISLEILCRMADTSPFIPYEMGKYILFLGLLAGLLFEHRKGVLGIAILLCLVPSMFFDLSGDVRVNNFIFNVLGPVNLGLAIWYFYRQPFTLQGLKTIMRFMIYPILTVVGYIIIDTPDFTEVDFSLGANFETTGGFGSNQVSTVLGLGMYLVFLFWINNWKLTGSKLFDLMLMLLLTFRGLISFSRGGMIGGLIGILVFIMVIKMASMSRTQYKLPSVNRYLIIGSLSLVIVFVGANLLTEGSLLLRYQGETAGTLAGVREKNLNALTTGRWEIFQEDLELFLRHPVTGVGVGASRYLRDLSEGVSSHVELSRLMSEHGIFGFLNFFLITMSGLVVYFQNRNPLYRAIFSGFFLVGLFSLFHSATRTYVSPLIIGLSFIMIVTIRKKQLSS